MIPETGTLFCPATVVERDVVGESFMFVVMGLFSRTSLEDTRGKPGELDPLKLLPTPLELLL